MINSVQPHRRQPNRFPHPWDSPGKNTGVGCHFLLQCMKVQSEREVTQSCPTLSDPMDCSLPGSSILAWRIPWTEANLCVLAQSCPSLCNSMACSLPDSSVHGILQARTLEWAAISLSREPFSPRGWTLISRIFCMGRQILCHCTTWEAPWPIHKYHLKLNYLSHISHVIPNSCYP